MGRGRPSRFSVSTGQHAKYTVWWKSVKALVCEPVPNNRSLRGQRADGDRGEHLWLDTVALALGQPSCAQY